MLLNLGARRAIDIAPWSDPVQYVHAWVGDGTPQGLTEVLTTWFGAPTKR